MKKTSRSAKKPPAKSAEINATGASPVVPKLKPQRKNKKPGAAARRAAKPLSEADAKQMSFEAVLEALSVVAEAYRIDKEEMRNLLFFQHWREASDESVVRDNAKSMHERVEIVEHILRDYLELVRRHRQHLGRVLK